MLLAMLFADKALVADQAKKFNATIDPWVWGILVALRFAAGIAILLFGVRMFLAEIVPAFVGVSDRIIPGSKPALDVPTVFPSAPTAVMVGFLSSTVTFLILMAIFGAAGWFTLVPPMIMLFFPGGGAGVFGNTYGGWRGAAHTETPLETTRARDLSLCMGRPDPATYAQPASTEFSFVHIPYTAGNLIGGQITGGTDIPNRDQPSMT